MKVVSLLGSLMVVALGVNWISKYGTQWDLSGRYCMPTTLLSPDGQTYRDGSPIDNFTKRLVDLGIEQEAWLVMAGVLLVLFTAAAFQRRRLHRMQMKAFDRELRRIRDAAR
jgi:hypothetical protein